MKEVDGKAASPSKNKRIYTAQNNAFLKKKIIINNYLKHNRA